MTREGQEAMLSIQMFKESDVIKMTTKAYFSVRVREELKRNGHTDRLKGVESMAEERKKSAMRILVPVNSTDECEIPIALARQLAGAAGAEIYLVRVVEWIDAFSGLRFDPDILRMMDDAARYLVELASRLGLPEDRTRPLVSWSDNAAKEIISIAKNEGIDLIITASRRKGWLQRLAQGNSLCSHLVRSQVCPVLCVPLTPMQASRRDGATAAMHS
jgi:nucleotide-binding universal stress UspA family protein